MVVVPLVFASLLVGTASLKDLRTLGRIGIKTLAFYTCTTAIAVTIGLLLTSVVRPGSSLPPESRQKLIGDAAAQKALPVQAADEKPSIRDLLLGIIPTNPIKALAEAQMLQIIFFAMLMGICLTLIPPDRGRIVIDFFKALDETIVQMVHVIMKLAPYAVFALIAAVVADFGFGILVMLIRYCIVVLVGLAAHMVLVYGLALKAFTRTSVAGFFRGLRPAQLMGFCSSSSNATLPVSMECVEKNLGVPLHICSFTLPLGATINMDGTCVHLPMFAILAANLFGIELTLGSLIVMVITTVLASIGAGGVPGGSLMLLFIILENLGLTADQVAVIVALALGINPILDMFETMNNVTGDLVCTYAVAANQDLIDPHDA